LDEVTLSQRIEDMIQSQTFGILRDPRAVSGAQRISSPKMQKIFRDAEHKSGVPASLLAAIAYVESFGDPRAESPSGPRGIVQISEATARRIGLKVARARRYKVTVTRVQVRNKRGKIIYKKIRRKQRYEVVVRDDRLIPERAVPAAAKYLASMEQRFGGRDWAIFAYHCGEGCVGGFQDLLRSSPGLNETVSVAKMFFSCSPAFHRDLYENIQRQMERDYSPTYWFRVMRAERLLALYQEDPSAFRDLAEAYRYRADPAHRAPDRLAVWLTPGDLTSAVEGSNVVQAPDAPQFLGYRLPPGEKAVASPAAIGTLIYIAYETRRLYTLMEPDGEPFVPLQVSALLRHADLRNGLDEHATGQVIDLSLTRLPAAERQCLRFVLDDLGWSGNLGFIEEAEPSLQRSTVMHIGCAPASRSFFSKVYAEAMLLLQDRVSGIPRLPGVWKGLAARA
jgi:hypothetical protein